MAQYPYLQTAHTGAFEGFLPSASSAGIGYSSPRAVQYFTERAEREANPPRIIHDREYPQPWPQVYTPGQPGPLQYGVPYSAGFDPGVYAVSTALFTSSGAFQAIPLKPGPIFRRRRRGDCQSEWSNAFVSRVDPCECSYPEETYTPYEVARYRDQLGNSHTTLDFSR